jgi:hypothetical protein
MTQLDVRRVLAGGMAALVAGCCTVTETKDMSAIVADVGVRVTGDGAGGYDFAYSGKYSDAEGNIDLTQGDAYGRAVEIRFAIDVGSAPGIRFKPDGRDAMWIARKDEVGDGSPQGPYRGDQFTDFMTAGDGLSLRVLDRNDDVTVYRYALRFDLNGETVADDPDIRNDGEY